MDKHLLNIISGFLFSVILSCTGVQKIKSKEKPPLKEWRQYSQKQALPYGKPSIASISFPEEWYCGGGYLTGSLKEAGYPTSDSIKYSKQYFELLNFNKDADFNNQLKEVSLAPQLKAKLKLEGKTYAFIHLPFINGVEIFGIILRDEAFLYNPVFITVKNNQVVDCFKAYEKSRNEVQENRLIYIDAKGIFYARLFTNIDGYLVQVKPLGKFQIDKQGYFREIN